MAETNAALKTVKELDEVSKDYGGCWPTCSTTSATCWCSRSDGETLVDVADMQMELLKQQARSVDSGCRVAHHRHHGRHRGRHRYTLSKRIF